MGIPVTENTHQVRFFNLTENPSEKFPSEFRIPPSGFWEIVENSQYRACVSHEAYRAHMRVTKRSFDTGGIYCDNLHVKLDVWYMTKNPLEKFLLESRISPSEFGEMVEYSQYRACVPHEAYSAYVRVTKRSFDTGGIYCDFTGYMALLPEQELLDTGLDRKYSPPHLASTYRLPLR